MTVARVAGCALLALAGGCSSSSGDGKGGDAGASVDGGDAAAMDTGPDGPRPPGDWSCLGNPMLAGPAKPTLTWQLEPVDIVTGGTFKGLVIQECTTSDGPCAAPLFLATTDPATGIATIPAPTGMTGFDGFWKTLPTGDLPTLDFSNVPIVDDLQIEKRTQWSTSDVHTVLGAAGAAWDKTRGIVWFQTLDCLSIYLHQDEEADAAIRDRKASVAAGVSVALGTAPAGVTGGYLAAGAFSTTAKQTDASGEGGFVGVPEGWVTLTATLVATGQTIGTGQVYAAAGGVSSIVLSPSQ